MTAHRLIVPTRPRSVVASEQAAADAQAQEALRARHLDLARRQWAAGYRETAVMHAEMAGVSIEEALK